VELDPRYAPCADGDGLGQFRQGAGVHGGIEHLGLLGEVPVGRGLHVLLERGQVLQAAADAEMIGVVHAGLGTQEPIALLVLLDE